MITKRKEKIFKITTSIICSLLLVISILLLFSAAWYNRNYGDTGFDSILFTLLSDQGGVNNDLLGSFIKESALPTVIFGGIFVFLLFFLNIKKDWHPNMRFCAKAGISIVLSLVFFVMAGERVKLFTYLKRLMMQTTIYEDHYVLPSEENITFPEEKRNLIMIFLESMETTYMSKEEGGALEKNVIPELTRLAENNINFSHNDGVGGFYSPEGTGWTVAGMVSQTSGIPLKGSSGALANNEYGKEEFLPGATTLSNILHDAGYNQALMVGSFSTYANRDVFFSSHNTDTIYDLTTAREEGIVPEDYYVWWGMEDKYLFSYAKDKIRKMAKGDEPFAFTLLTVDTHFANGYYCSLCKNKYEEQYNNVLACSSRQVLNFVNWIKKQSFYKDTTIVLVGDHLTMDYPYVERNIPNDYKRRVYNCFINSAVESENYKNRNFTSLDIFPTTLAAVGCEIKGDRLGLGTNLFSDTPTFAEVMGHTEFEREMLYSSSYYIKNFLIDANAEK